MDRPVQQTFDTVQIPLYDAQQISSYSLDSDGILGLGATQTYVNMIPKTSKNTQTGEPLITLQKRQGFESQMDMHSKAALTGDVSVRDMISMTQCSDVLVVAMYKNNAGTKTIEILQVRPTANTALVIGTISTVVGPPAVNISETTDVYLTEIKQGNVPGVAVVITDDSGSSGTSAGYYALTSSGVFTATTLTKISDADFPTNQTPYVHIVGPFQQMNQVTYIMASDGRIYNSNADNIGTWAALGYLEAEAYADKGVGLMRYKHHIVGFGLSTVEFFDDIGNDPTTGSPLQRTDQAFIKFGAVYGKTTINVDDVLYWVSSSSSNTVGVWRLDGYTPVKVSTDEVDRFITGSLEATTTGAVNSMCLQQCLINNSKQLVLSGLYDNIQSIGFWSGRVASGSYETDEPTLPTDGQVKYSSHYVLNIDSNIWWWLYKGGSDYINDAIRLHGYFASIGPVGYAAFGLPNLTTPLGDGKRLFKISQYNNDTLFTDYSTADAAAKNYTAFYATNFLFFGTNKRKFMNKLRLWKNTYPDSRIVITEKGQVNIVVLKDGTVMTNTGLPVVLRKMPLQGANNTPVLPFWSANALGSFYRCQVQIGYHGAQPWDINGLEVDLAQGTH